MNCKICGPASLHLQDNLQNTLTELFQHIHRIPIQIADGDLKRHLPGQGMRRAAKAWIVGTECHLNHVEQTFCHLAFLDEMGRCLVSGHLDRRVIIGSAGDEIRLRHDAAFIGPVVMRERAGRERMLEID
jgi:hypothetical protein